MIDITIFKLVKRYLLNSNSFLTRKSTKMVGFFFLVFKFCFKKTPLSSVAGGLVLLVSKQFEA